MTQYTKDQIEKEALVEFPKRLIGTHTGSVYDQNEHDRAIWKEGATKYAEKLEVAEGNAHELAQLKDVIKTVIIHLQQFDTQEWFEVFGEDKFRPYKILNKLQDAIANKLELK